MEKTYRAVYYNSSGRFYNATIFLSSVTLSIRYVDESTQSKDVYWLAENILSLEQEATSSVLQYKSKEGLAERLVIRDIELLHAVKKHFRHHPFAGGWRARMLGSTRSKIFLFLAILVTIILAGYLFFIPWLGERIAGSISKEWEISMGEKMHQSMMGSYRIDSARSVLINRFYKELHYKINYPVKITVVESKEVNAFAIPGGNVVVYTALLSHLQKPEDLAALLSHEASHIQLRHSLRNIFRSMARKMFLMLLLGNEAGLAGFLVDNADNLKGLEYSRSLETEADNNGISLMQGSNIDAAGMLRLMEILQQETKGKEPAAFLSTHPVFESRIENIKRHIGNSSKQGEKNVSLESIFSNLR